MTRRASALALADAPFLVLDESPAPVVPIAQGPTRKVKVRAHRRTVRGPAEPTGEARRDAALATFTADEALRDARAYVRDQLAALYRTRVAWYAERPDRWYVTADDVADILEAWADYPETVRARPGHWKGSLFRKGWRLTGRSVPSTRKHMHATTLPCWALAGEASA